MFDKQHLMMEAGLILLIGIVVSLSGHLTVSAIFASSSFVLFGIAQAIKPYNFPNMPRDLMVAYGKNAQMTANEVKHFMENYNNDPAFTQAVLYMHSLPPLDFMRLSRTVIELRQACDSAALRSIHENIRNKQ